MWQIEIQASDQAKAMVDAYRREYAKGDVAVYNNLAVKGIHIDNDYFMGVPSCSPTVFLFVPALPTGCLQDDPP